MYLDFTGCCFYNCYKDGRRPSKSAAAGRRPVAACYTDEKEKDAVARKRRWLALQSCVHLHTYTCKYKYTYIFLYIFIYILHHACYNRDVCGCAYPAQHMEKQVQATKNRSPMEGVRWPRVLPLGLRLRTLRHMR